ncbi:hypothetical protein MHYP_G00263990 [Metynnis hypsauchen]
MQSCRSSLCVLILLITTFTAGKPEAEEKTDIKGDNEGPSHGKPEAEEKTDIKGDNEGPSHGKPEAEEKTDIKGDNEGPSHGKPELCKQSYCKGFADGPYWDLLCMVAAVALVVGLLCSRALPEDSELIKEEEKFMPLESSKYRLMSYELIKDEEKSMPLESSKYRLMSYA